FGLSDPCAASAASRCADSAACPLSVDPAARATLHHAFELWQACVSHPFGVGRGSARGGCGADSTRPWPPGFARHRGDFPFGSFTLFDLPACAASAYGLTCRAG